MPDTQQGYGLGAETALPSRNCIEFRAFRNNHSASVLKTMSKQDERVMKDELIYLEADLIKGIGTLYAIHALVANMPFGL